MTPENPAGDPEENRSRFAPPGSTLRLQRVARVFLFALFGSLAAFTAPFLFGTTGLKMLAVYFGIAGILGVWTFFEALAAGILSIAVPAALAVVLIVIFECICLVLSGKLE